MKKFKNDNRGFTLAELLIAITILAIVLAPLFRNFVESTRINAKARVTMNATNMASNIAEGLNAYSAEEIIMSFDSADDRGNMRIFPDDIICGSHGEMIADPADPGAYVTGYYISGTTAHDENGTAQYVSGDSTNVEELKFVPSADSKYVLFATGVQQEKTTYDIIVQMDASSATPFSGDLDENGVIEGTEEERYNDYEEVKITTLNRLVDSVYKDNSTIWNDVRASFAGYSQSGTLDQKTFNNYFGRTIVVDVDMFNEGGKNKTQVSVHSDYEYHGWHNPYSITELSTPDDVIYESNTQYPRDIYIYYYPNYNYDLDAPTDQHSDKNATTAAHNVPSDQFVINNNAGIDVSVHLIRLLPGDIPAGDLALCEAGYHTHVTLNDNVDGDIHTKIYSNLKDNLTATEEDNRTTYRQNASRCGFTMNGITYNVSDDEYKEVLFEQGGLATEVRDRLYSVVILVYEEGAAANGFPEDSLLATYDGASAKQ